MLLHRVLRVVQHQLHQRVEGERSGEAILVVLVHHLEVLLTIVPAYRGGEAESYIVL